MSLDDLLNRYFGETPEQIAHNKLTGQKPDHMSWDDWCDHRSPYWKGTGRSYFDACHWYDPKHLTPTGHCWGGLDHNHQPRYMKWYWASPLAQVIPPLFFLWEARTFVLNGLLDKLGWYWFIDKIGWGADQRCSVKGCYAGNDGYKRPEPDERLCITHFNKKYPRRHSVR